MSNTIEAVDILEDIDTSHNNTLNASDLIKQVNENLQCFICNIEIQGSHYSLGTCRTQQSNTKIVEKLGELIGERYIIVVSQDDVICRGCANMINTFDRLEAETKNVKDIILRFLEYKYALDDGELTNTEKMSQLSHIKEFSQHDNICNTDSLLPSNLLPTNDNTKKQLLLQCDECPYSTSSNTFMIHHIRQHINKNKHSNHGIKFLSNEDSSHLHNSTDNTESCSNYNRVKEGIAECGSIIEMDNSVMNMTQEDLSLLNVHHNIDNAMQAKEKNNQYTESMNSTNIQFHQIIASDNLESTLSEPMYVHVISNQTEGESDVESFGVDTDGINLEVESWNNV